MRGHAQRPLQGLRFISSATIPIVCLALAGCEALDAELPDRTASDGGGSGDAAELQPDAARQPDVGPPPDDAGLPPEGFLEVDGASSRDLTTTCAMYGTRRFVHCWGSWTDRAVLDRPTSVDEVYHPGYRDFSVAVGTVCIDRGWGLVMCFGDSNCFMSNTLLPVEAVQTCLAENGSYMRMLVVTQREGAMRDVGFHLHCSLGYPRSLDAYSDGPVPNPVPARTIQTPVAGILAQRPTWGDLCGGVASWELWPFAVLDDGGRVWDQDGQAWSVLPFSGPVSDVASSGLHACGLLRADGSVECLGANGRGQLGRPTERTVILDAPVRPPVPPAVQVVASDHLSCALDEAGAVRCWGSGSPEPAVVELPEPTAALARHGLCALSVNGNLYCWGSARPEHGAEVVSDGVVRLLPLPE